MDRRSAAFPVRVNTTSALECESAATWRAAFTMAVVVGSFERRRLDVDPAKRSSEALYTSSSSTLLIISCCIVTLSTGYLPAADSAESITASDLHTKRSVKGHKKYSKWSQINHRKATKRSQVGNDIVTEWSQSIVVVTIRPHYGHKVVTYESKMAVAQSEASARVGVGFSIILSIICVAMTTGLPSSLQVSTMRF